MLPEGQFLFVQEEISQANIFTLFRYLLAKVTNSLKCYPGNIVFRFQFFEEGSEKSAAFEKRLSAYLYLPGVTSVI